MNPAQGGTTHPRGNSGWGWGSVRCRREPQIGPCAPGFSRNGTGVTDCERKGKQGARSSEGQSPRFGAQSIATPGDKAARAPRTGDGSLGSRKLAARSQRLGDADTWLRRSGNPTRRCGPLAARGAPQGRGEPGPAGRTGSKPSHRCVLREARGGSPGARGWGGGTAHRRAHGGGSRRLRPCDPGGGSASRGGLRGPGGEGNPQQPGGESAPCVSGLEGASAPSRSGWG